MIRVRNATDYVAARNEFVRHSVVAKREYKKNKERYGEFRKRAGEERGVIQDMMEEHDWKCVSVKVPRLDETSRSTGEHDVVYIKKCERTINPTFNSKVLGSVLEGNGGDDAEADVQRVSDLVRTSMHILKEHQDRMEKARVEREKEDKRRQKRERSEETKEQTEERKRAREKERQDAREFKQREELRIKRLEQSIARNMGPQTTSGLGGQSKPPPAQRAPALRTSTRTAGMGVLERRIIEAQHKQSSEPARPDRTTVPPQEVNERGQSKNRARARVRKVST